jgi:hypothetical protein
MTPILSTVPVSLDACPNGDYGETLLISKFSLSGRAVLLQFDDEHHHPFRDLEFAHDLAAAARRSGGEQLNRETI